MQRLQELERERDEDLPGYSSSTEETTRLSDKQKYYQVIFSCIETVLRERPEEMTVVLRRLEKELQELLADRKKHPAAPVAKPIEPSR
jgi:hypothetical protein